MVGVLGPSSPAVATESRPIRPDRRWLLVPLVASALILLLSAGRLDRPFGPAYQDFNTAVWATGAQSVQSEGWWDARLGGLADRDGSLEPYAHHPALTQVAASAAGSTLGDERWSYRSAALAFAIAGVWACWGWLGACAFAPSARSFGVLVTAGSPLLLDYGVMLNMEIVWLPFLFGLLWAWKVAEDHPGHRRAGALCGAVALLGGLAAHQGILLAGALAAGGLVRAAVARRRPQSHVLWTLAGACGGGLLFLGWVLWVNGGIGGLTRRAGLRMVTTSWPEWAALQAGHLVVLFGALGAAVLLGGAWLLRGRPELWLSAGAVAAVTLAYATVFRGGSGHPYWNAGLVALVALGGALTWERVRRSSLPLAPMLGIVCVLPFVGAAWPTAPGRAEDHVAAVSAAASSQPRLYGTMLLGEWATYETGRPATTVATCERVLHLAGRQADAAVITTRQWVHARSGPLAWSRLSDGALERHGDVALVRAADLADVVC